MHVIYDHQIFCAQQYGGVSRYFYELIKNILDSNGAEVTLFRGLHINKYPIENLAPQMKGYFGIHSSNVPRTGCLFRFVNAQLFELYILSSSRRYDIYHPTYYSDFVHKWRRGPVVLTIYDMIYELFPENFKHSQHLIDVKRKCIQRADKIIAISNTTKNDLQRFYNVDQSKVCVIYMGYPEIPLLESGGFSNPRKRSYILYVGTRSGYKGFKTLLMAYAKNYKITKECDLICFGGGLFTKDERKSIHELGCDKKIIQVSGNDELLHTLYRHASAFVYPSLYEGFGLAPLEALACGCPVIASNAGSIPEVVGDAGLYFDPWDCEALTEALLKVLYEDKIRDTLTAKGYNQLEKYSWQKTALETLSVYKSLI